MLLVCYAKVPCGSKTATLISLAKASCTSAIIECKLAANPEVKRKVIRQIFEYAAYLWGMSYEEVDGRIQKLKGKSLADLVAECVAGEWDGEQFREGVRRTLEKALSFS